MPLSKRLLDLGLSLLLLAILALPLLVLIGFLLWREGRPVFFLSERMAAPDRAFRLIKLRTMQAAPDDGRGVTGGDKAGRVSPLQKFVRRLRIDEIPQLLNVIRGEMSLVGPRPPLRVYVEDFPDLYREVLRMRPGITGLASLRYHAREEALLSGCATAAETDRVYRTRCVPQKARLDLIHARNWSLCFDLALLWETGLRVLRRG